MTPCAASDKTAYAVYAITAFFILAFVYWTDPGMATFVYVVVDFIIIGFFQSPRLFRPFGPLPLMHLAP